MLVQWLFSVWCASACCWCVVVICVWWWLCGVSLVGVLLVCAFVCYFCVLCLCVCVVFGVLCL